MFLECNLLDLSLDLDSGFDINNYHDFDFQDIDTMIEGMLIEEELGYAVSEDPNAKWQKTQKFPWRFERISDKKKAWANRTGFDNLVKTKRFKFLGFDSTLATSQQKTQWKELSALLAKLGPAPAPKPTPKPATTTPTIGVARSALSTPAPTPNPSANSRWQKKQKFPWRFERLSDKKKAWANRKGFDELVKTKKFKFLGFDNSLATSTQKKEQAKILEALKGLSAPAPSTTAPPHAGTKWSKTNKFPWRFERISDKKKIWANKAGFDYLTKTGKYKFVAFDDSLATDDQKKQQAKILEALKGLTPKQAEGLAKMATEPVPHSGTKWAKTQGYPWFFNRVADNRPLWANRPGFDYIVKTKQYKFTKFDDSLASEYQKQQWKELSVLLAKLPPPGSAAMAGLEKMGQRQAMGLPPVPSSGMMTLPKGLLTDVQDIKKMLQFAELQRQATSEHEEIEATKAFRRQVLDRLMRIADAVLASDSPLYNRVRTAYIRG